MSVSVADCTSSAIGTVIHLAVILAIAMGITPVVQIAAAIALT